MSISAVQNGKGYEWAIARALERKLGIPIREDKQARSARQYFEALSQEMQARFDLSAEIGIEFLIDLEKSKIGTKPPRQIHLMADSEGKLGDVRDVVVTAGTALFGISCKSNSKAYKHPRLSSSVDWVEKWGINSRGASEDYWKQVKPIFEVLQEIKDTSGGTALFRNLENLHRDFYLPILLAFETELHRQVDLVGGNKVAAGLASYVIGKNDFYKFISMKKELIVQQFNFEGTLAGARSQLPTKLLAVDRLEGSQFSLTLRFDRGYVFNLRLHSASSRVEPSLKFDVQAIGLPANEIRQNYLSF